MPWFRKTQLEPLAVTMTAVKLGERLLVVGAGDVALTAALAAKAGLTGRACVLDASQSTSTSAAAAVERQGALIESFTSPWTMLPFDADSFDVVVIRNVWTSLDAEPRIRAASEIYRVLRPGGRSIVIDDVARARFGGFRGQTGDPVYERSGGATHLLEAAGFRGVRTLAAREGQRFVEGIKAAG
jgi:ubiquinone/menaquinone biosynthesis C-methylase UbiE